MRPRPLFRVLALTVCCAATASFAQSQDPQQIQCDAQHDLDKYQLLRRLSLDLRGRVPTYEEYQALDAGDGVPESLVQSWLSTDDFRVMMRRYHDELLWPNVGAARFANVNARLRDYGFGALAVTSAGKHTLYRGSADVTSTTYGAQCGDYEQTHFDPAYPGQFRPDPAYVKKTAAGDVQEGWRYVTPYWAPGTQVKVCAFDAQETPSTMVGSKTVSCASAEADGKKECGCGPNLNWCFSPSATDTDTPLRDAIREQLERAVDDVTTGGRPYTDLVLSTKAYENGRIAHWKKYLASHYSLSLTYDVADPSEPIPNKTWDDTTWTKVDRGGLHSGVLTLPGYLLRFQTNRGRANRERIAFECEYFVPPAQTPDQPGCSNSTDDLMNRCTCQYCHATLEPLAARFGQFAEAGTTHLTDLTKFPRDNPTCRNNPNSSFCKRFYVTESSAHRFGWLLPVQFADVHKEVDDGFKEGPRGHMQEVIDNGTFARCTVRHVFEYFVKREMRAQGSDNDEQALLQSLADGFSQNNYDFPWLVEQVVTLPQYRRIH